MFAGHLTRLIKITNTADPHLGLYPTDLLTHVVK